MADAKKNDDAKNDPGENADERNGADVPAPPHHEDVTSTTTHTVTIDGEPIEYTATAGHLVIGEEEGKKQASFFSISYVRNDIDDSSNRPVVFSFNGGPGSSSVWLHLGAFGPRRVVLADDGMPLPPPGRLTDNEYSILDVADLVFIDPVSTGYSRAIPEEDAKNFHHFTKDLESVGEFIRMWLARNHRWGSPKFLAGESYGTTRSAGLAGHLLKRHGLYFNGLVLVSSILNFQTAGFDQNTWTFRRGNDLPYVLFLPTYTATAWYHGRLPEDLQSQPLADVVTEVEEWASTEYTLALMEGSRLDADRRAAVIATLARYTGLSEEYVANSDMRIEILRFCKELLRDEGRTVGRIDSRYKGIDRLRTGHMMENDPSIDATMGVYTSALNDYVRGDLEFETDLPYEVLTDRVHPWDYEDFKNAYVDVSETLRETMSRNPFMKVYVGNGFFDLATPHFATEYTFSHLGLDEELRGNVTMRYYEGGHMMYVVVDALAQMRTDIVDFIESATASR
jgi:carboxypeptidase C (cathepsin A)